MGALSGKYAEAQIGSCEFAEFESWDLNYGAGTPEYNSRSGGGASQSVEGVISGGGSISGFIDPDDSLYASSIRTGSLLALTLRHTATGPVVATGQGRLGQFRYGASRAGEPQPVTIPFVTHGLWTVPGQ